YLDPTVIGPWTTTAVQELQSLIPLGLIGAQQYCVDSHGGGFELIDSSNNLTPQGQAFQAAMGSLPSPTPTPSSTPTPTPTPKPSPTPTTTPSGSLVADFEDGTNDGFGVGYGGQILSES